MNTLNNILEFEIIHFNQYSLTGFEILNVIIIFLVAKLLLWIIRKAIFQKTKIHKLDKGSSIALFQLTKYVVWILAITLILETIGIKVTLLLAGSAALLVGIGLGLQQTFNDILSGIILLFEHSVKVGDILQIDGDIVKIQDIGLRTSKGMNVRQIIVIIPNSLITTNKVINWSHQTQKTLFSIDISVSYDNDIDQVISLLEKSALEHKEVLESDLLEGRLVGFGQSGMNYKILFYSQNIFFIEKVKSDIRKNIFSNFKKNNITIPFPQLDIHVI